MGRETKQRQASERTKHMIVQAAWMYAAFWVAYSVVAVYAQMTSGPISGPLAVCILGITWLSLAWRQWQTRSLEGSSPGWTLAGFHILSAVYIIGVVGAASPLVFLWSLQIIASGVYFGRRGSLLSGMTLLPILLITANLNDIKAALMVWLTTSFFGLAVSFVINQSQSNQLQLDESMQQASLQRDRTTTLINNLTDAVISTDQNASITLYNAAALNLLDTNTDLDDKNIDDVLQLRSSDGQIVSLAEELFDANAANHRDDLVTLISGETTRLDIAYSPIRSSYDEDNEHPDELAIGGFIVIIRDITKSKSLEEERDEFISVVSHELRTPITIAEGTISNAQLMLDRPGVAQKKIKSAVDMAHDQVVFLARMVNDLSTLSRAERGVADEAEEIDVNELVKTIFEEHQDEAAEKDLKFNLNLPTKLGTVIASRLYLKELLQNFVTNAIKYTNQGSITISARLSKGQVLFSVKDTGIGISQADQKQIFEKFYRAEDYRTRESNGTGLGLYVAAKLARKLDTDIQIKSRLNFGSEFSFSMPLDGAESAEKSA